MPDQIMLAWTVSTVGTPIGPAQAASKLAGVPLYREIVDPVLGQFFGLTVAEDETTSDATSATRTLTLNMNASETPTAPPPFQCHPRTSSPPTLPYTFRTTKDLPGSFFVTNGSASIPTANSERPSIVVGDSIQFLAQQGVFYEVNSVTPMAIGLTAAYTGVTGSSKAFKEVDAPVVLAAIYSSSPLDTIAVDTTPAIAAGPGARTVQIVYNDSTGAGPFTATVSLTGTRPVAVALAGGIDFFEIENILIASTGAFGNSVGEITFVELTEALPSIPSGIPLGTGVGAAQGTTFKTLTDDAQLLIDRHLVYLPPSYFALAQQSLSSEQLEGAFLVTTGSAGVPSSEDQTSQLAAGDVISFAAQPDTRYTIEAVTPKIVTLTAVYTGIDTNNTGDASAAGTNNTGTKGNIGEAVTNKATGAQRVDQIQATVPTDAQLSVPIAQFVALETAAPPPDPPADPSTVPLPTFLSGLFTRTLQLALAGVPVSPATITFV